MSSDQSPFPRQSNAQSIGSLGVVIVESIVRNDLKWEFRRTPQEADFGIDGYIDIVTPERYVTGRSLAVQIKSGDSYFRSPTKDGWLYRGEVKHVNYYIHMPQPVLLMLVNVTEKKAWWRLFEPYETDRNGDSWTIPIQQSNSLSQESKQRLSGIAGGAIDYLPHLDEFWLLREKIKTNDLLFVQVLKFEVETANTRPFEKIFERLSASPATFLDARGKVDFVFAGYDKDPRELFEIDEVVQWIRLMLQRVDSLPYLLSLRDEAQGIETIISVIAGAKKVSAAAGLTYVEYTTPMAVPEFIREQWGKLNKITDTNGLPEELNKEITFQLRDRASLSVRRRQARRQEVEKNEPPHRR